MNMSINGKKRLDHGKWLHDTEFRWDALKFGWASNVCEDGTLHIYFAQDTGRMFNECGLQSYACNDDKDHPYAYIDSSSENYDGPGLVFEFRLWQEADLRKFEHVCEFTRQLADEADRRYYDRYYDEYYAGHDYGYCI